MNDSKALKLVCAGMLQSWRNTWLGPNNRYTELIPTKSGITGMIACALGYPRGDTRIRKLENSFNLYLNNRESGPIQEAKETIPDVLLDFQTVFAPEMLKAGSNSPYKTPSVLHKEYIVGYRYVLYLFADEDILHKIESALKNPVWDYYLGSKCCIPAEPVCQGICIVPKEEDENVYQYIQI